MKRVQARHASSSDPGTTGESTTLSGKMLGALAVAIFGLCARPGAVQAAAPSDELAEITVTGTLIRGVTTPGAPVTTVDAQGIRESGVRNVTDLLHDVLGVPRVSLDPQNVNREPSNLANIAAINLHGLDTPSTLTLIDGHRTAPGGVQHQGFDVSNIPTNAIQRVEVLADGSSATYGADAVAGVVNLILRRPENVAETSLDGGRANSYTTGQIGQTLGRTWGSGGVFVAYQHSHNSHLPARARSFYTDDFTPYGGLNQALFPPFGTVSNPGTIAVFGPGGTTYAIPHGQNGVGLTPGSLTPGTVNTQSTLLGVDALGSETRDSGVLNFNQTLTDKINWFAEGFYSNRDNERANRALSRYVRVPSTNPFYIPGLVSNNRTEVVKYSFSSDFGPQVFLSNEKAMSFLTGLDFDIGSGWNATTLVSYSRDKTYVTSDNFSPTALDAALADPNPATAFNAFGDGSFTNPQTLAKIKGLTTYDGDYKTIDFNVKADGPIFMVPAGTVRLAVGAEHLADTFHRHRYDNTVTGLPDTSVYILQYAVDTSRRVDSAFAELYLPLVDAPNRIPGVEKLTLSVAGRYDHYSDAGSTTNPKIGLTWVTSLPGLALNATYGTSFRAPTLIENDGIYSPSTVNLFNPATGTVQQGLALLQDNTNLKPVTSTTFTVGFDYKPTGSKGLALSAEYYSVKTTNYITSPVVNGDFLTNPIYSKYIITLNPAAAQVQAAALIAAHNTWIGPSAPASDINFIIDSRDTNLGELNTSGFDFRANYTWDANNFGTWSTGVRGTYVFDFKSSQYAGAPLVDNVNTNNGVPLTLVGQVHLGWRRGGFYSDLILNYQNAYQNTDYPNAGVPPYAHIASYETVDFHGAYDFDTARSGSVTDGLSIGFNVRNLLNRDPPIALTPDEIRTPLAIDTYHSNVIGRYFSVWINKRW